MRELQESGIEWIGDIPLDWETDRIGSLYIERKEKCDANQYC